MKAVTESDQITRVVLRGYKSIAECDIKLGRLNILIGANGAGKSNFVNFFGLVQRILSEQLQVAVGEGGGPDSFLHFGRKTTEEIHAELYFGNNGYKFSLQPTQDNRLMFSSEALWWNMRGDWHTQSGHFESRFRERNHHGAIWTHTVPSMRSWRRYHFHDTSRSALVKQLHGINDNEYLRDDGRNLAAFLYRLQQQHEKHYQRIVKVVQLVAPFFGDFHLRPAVGNPEQIQLEWTERNQDVPFTAATLSDGTLRLICLAAVLLQPEEFKPASILIDEPELGLHPYAITVLAGLMKSASERHQLIVSTQSVELVNEFDAEDLIVTDKPGNASTLKRLDVTELNEWLEEYSLGDLWKKNLLGGRPAK